MDPEFMRGSTYGLTAKEHRCTIFCDISHEFGNIYRCKTSGRRHVCDATCDQRCMHGKDTTRCLLSGKIHPAPAEMLKRMCRKRHTEDSDMEEPSHKRSMVFDNRSMMEPTRVN